MNTSLASSLASRLVGPARRVISALTSSAGRSRGVQAGGVNMVEQLEDRIVLNADLSVLGTFNGVTLGQNGGALAGSFTLRNTGTTAANGFQFRVVLSLDDTLGNGDDVVLNTNPAQGAINLGAGATTSRNLADYSVPANLNPGQYTLFVQADSTNAITESNENNNTFESTALVTINGLAADANLSATSTLALTNLNPQQQLTVPTTIRNTGAAAATNFSVTWALATNRQLTGDVFELGTEVISANLAATTGTLNVSPTFNLPVGLPTGQYFLVILTDADAEIDESNEADNTFVSTSAVVNVQRPDLANGLFTVTSGTAPVAPGGAITGRLQFSNIGTGPAGGFVASFTLSSNATIGDGDDIFLGEFVVPANLTGGVAAAAGTSRVLENVQFVLPFNINPGSYRLITRLDAASGVNETNESNNNSISATTVVTVPARNTANDPATGDFVVIGPSTGTFAAQRGGTLGFFTTVANLGRGTLSGAPISAYLSSDGTLDGADFLLGNDITDGFLSSVNSPGSAQGLIAINVPNNAPFGQFFLILVADETNTVTENNETNNTWVSQRAVVTINGASTGTANLQTTLSFGGGTFARGANVTLPTTFRNVTGTAATNVRVDYILSTDNIIGNSDDIAIGNTTLANVAGNSQTSQNLTFTLPNNLPGQPYFVAAVIDGNRLVQESNEGDNVSITPAATLTISAPDLQATIASAARTVSPGQQIEAQLTVRNASVVVSPAFSVRLLLSADGTVDGGDLVLQTYRVAGGLLGNGSTTIPVAIPLPSSVLPGSYRLIAVVDPTDEVFESNEGNNTAAQPATSVTVPTRNVANDPAGPDLVSRISTNAVTLAPGGTFTVRLQVTNQGNATTGGGFDTQYFLSPTATLGANAVPLPASLFSTQAPGATTLETTLSVPGFLASGTYFVIARADSDGDITETNENNNVSATATAVINVVRPTVSVVASIPTAREAGLGLPAANGQFTFTRTGPLTNALTINLRREGTASGGDVTGGLPTTVTIPAGAASVNLVIAPVTDGPEGPQTVRYSVDLGTGYDVSRVQGAATVTIADGSPLVTVAAIDAAAGEPTGAAVNTGTFRISRTGPVTAALTVNFTVAGTAVVGAGNNYTLTATAAGNNLTLIGNNGLITIPAGAAFIDVTVNPTDNATVNAARTVDLEIGTSGSNAYARGEARTATVNIADNEPTVSIIASDPAASEAVGNNIANPGQFLVTRTGGLINQALTVNYTISGTAVAGTNFTALSGTVTIPANATTATINVAALSDGLVGPARTVIATLASSPSYNITTVAAQTAATVTIADSSPTITIAAIDPQAGELRPTPTTFNDGVFRVTRTGGNLASAVTVTIDLSGTRSDAGFSLSTSTVGATLSPNGSTRTLTIPAGATFVDIAVRTPDDTTGTGNQTVIASIAAEPAYNRGVEATRTATVTVLDGAPTISVVAGDPLAADSTPVNTGSFTFTRVGGNLAQALTVPITLGGTAVSGTDYAALPATITFAANSAVATLTLTPIANAVGQNTRTVTVAPTSGVSVNVSPTQGSATVRIEDSSPRLNVAVINPITTEGVATPASVRVTRPTGTTGAFAFSFNLGGTATRGTDYVVSGGGVSFDPISVVWTATIPNGAQFVDLTFLAATRVAAAGTQSIEFVLRPDAGRYGVGGPTNGGATITVRDNKPTVTIAATIPNASEAQGNNIATNGRFTVTRVGAPLTAALTVTYAITGTATGGTDYTTLTGTVTIPAGAASANIDVAPLFDGTFEANETVIATLTAAGGATYNLGAVAQRTATVTIADRTPTVTIAAIRPVGAETAPGAVAQTGAYRITRSGGDTSRPLTVNYSVSGTATSALDYAALSGTATIPAGQTFVDVVVTPVTDIVTETPETVIATITPAATYSLGAEPTRASTVTINNVNLTDLRVVGSSLPTVTNISYDQAGVTVPAIVTINNPGSSLTGAVTVSVFWLTGSTIPVTAQPVLSQTLNGLANGDTTVDLTFALSTVGQVLPGVYNVGFRVTTPTGFVDINPNDNANVLSAGANGTTPAFYNVFAGSVATGSTISVAATDATAAEVPAGLPANGGTFTITRTGGNLSQRLVVPFTFASPASLPAATLNTDFLAFTRFVIFEAGQTSATVNIDVIDDTLAPVAEPREALRLVLTNSNAYAIGGSGDAEITIDDNEAVSVGVAGTQNGSNNGTTVVNGNFRFSRVGDTASAVTINYTVTGDAVAGTDYTALPGSVTIPAGANFVDVPVNVLANNIAGGNLGLILTIDPSANYAISTAFAPIAINDIRPTEIAAEAPTGDPFPPSNAGDPLTVTLNFLNNTSFLTRFSWTLFASTNNTLEVGTDVLLSSGTQLNTPAGAGSINSTFNLPTLASGTYFLIFSITPRGAETNTANNVASTTTAVLTIV